ncbi:MAG TPA: ABC transporter ATP-binding protein [Mycobacteriales bacterium]|jgi:osmoprotectant transport system ATP-binding protein|nr:ABC transporter ATP-binding protein [Mycobacteriales bacterium]
MIKFDSVGKRYPSGTTAVDGLDLVAPSGRITVLVGPSGCGKTTSLRMVNRMVEPSSGTVWLDDRDTGKVDPAALRRGIGYVIQQAGLFPHRTIADNVATVPLLLGWDRRRARQRALELMERVGLPADLARRYPAQLSGGQQQRVGVARALAADPPVMLMDEPFSAVDPVVRHELQDEFLRLQSEIGKTILFVTHDIDEAVKLGDEVGVMRVGGKLAQLASPATLLAEPVDDFVAGFVGRDRGYRSLGFRAAGELSLTEEPTVRIGTDGGEAARVAQDDWLLAVDADGQPQGWLDARELRAGTPVGPDLLHRGGTTARADDSLRAALDAALSAPSGRGVIVDGDGRLLGTISTGDVVARIEAERERRQAQLEDATAGGGE